MIGSPGTEVSIGRAPAQRRDGEANFLDVRRSEGDSVFVAVHEPYRGSPRVASIRALEVGAEADGIVGLQVELTSGRKDVIAWALDAPPYPTHNLPATDVSFRGRFVHVAWKGQNLHGMYPLEGASLSVDDEVLVAAGGDFSHRGTVTGVLRSAGGDDENAFSTNVELPLAGLDGKMSLLLPDGQTEGYTIEGVRCEGGLTTISVGRGAGIGTA